MEHPLNMFPQIKYHWSMQISTTDEVPGTKCSSKDFTHIVASYPPTEYYDQREHQDLHPREVSESDWYCWASWEVPTQDKLTTLSDKMQNEYQIQIGTASLKGTCTALNKNQYVYWKNLLQHRCSKFYMELRNHDQQHDGIPLDASLEQFVDLFDNLPSYLSERLYYAVHGIADDFDDLIWAVQLHPFIDGVALHLHHPATWAAVLHTEGFDQYTTMTSNGH